MTITLNEMEIRNIIVDHFNARGIKAAIGNVSLSIYGVGARIDVPVSEEKLQVNFRSLLDAVDGMAEAQPISRSKRPYDIPQFSKVLLQEDNEKQ